MMKWPLRLLVITLISCGGAGEEAGICDRYFEPYPDLTSSNEDTGTGNTFTSGMALYSAGEFAQAADSLQAHTDRRGYRRQAHLYLAMCHLALDRPYDAELQLDHLRNSNLNGFEDQIEWYTLLCWVCSGQHERALPEAHRIAARRHTYRQQAARLAKELESRKDR